MSTAPLAFDLDAARAEIPLLADFIPLNNCSQAPQTHRTAGAARTWLESWNRRGMDWNEWLEEVDACRTAFATLIGANPGDVAVTSSVSAATAAVASALEFGGPRNGVVASSAEFPGVGHVWSAHRARGAKVEWVPLRDGQMHVADYADRIDERTMVVSATHAWYQNGTLQDIPRIARLARDAGALIYVDAYQTAGVVPIDVHEMDVDFLASGTLKYLLGVPGIAFLYVRPSLADTLHPVFTGWFGRKDPFTFDARTLDWASGALRFDTGTPPIPNAYISRAGIETVTDIGVEAIRQWTLALSARTVDRVRARGLRIHRPEDPAARSPVTAVRCDPADSADVERRLRERGILVSARGPVIRLAPHYYNTPDDIDQAVDALADILDPS